MLHHWAQNGLNAPTCLLVAISISPSIAARKCFKVDALGLELRVGALRCDAATLHHQHHIRLQSRGAQSADEHLLGCPPHCDCDVC